MAIDKASIQMWRILKPHLPANPAVLEIGQANWFGDVPASECEELQGIVLDDNDFFRTARSFYSQVLGYKTLDTVDRNGEEESHRLDLNYPLPFESGSYDIIINTGTTEHVFDQRQVFTTMHDMCKVGGLIVGCFPTVGCVDHGFYNHHPGLLHAIASVNEYETLAALRSELGGDHMMHLAWRKVKDEAFRLPYQGEYGNAMGGGMFRKELSLES